MRDREPPDSTRPWRRWVLLVAPIAALVALFVVTGARGVDLGRHWDEVDWHINLARGMVKTGVFLPHNYIYPTLSKWLVLLPALPPTLAAALTTGGNQVQIQQAMLSVVERPDILLVARKVFLVTSALTLVWLYAAALVLRRRPWEAFVAAACLGLSWEYAYHARWVVSDCILTQFAALMLLLLALYHRTRRVRWLYLAAVAVGLGAGTKTTGVLLMVPLFISSASNASSLSLRALRAQLPRLVLVGAIALGTFILTTPGVLLEPFLFVSEYHRIARTYMNDHGGYTARGWPLHARLVLTYLALDFFSPFRAAAIALFAASFVGAVAWARGDRRMAAVLLFFPIVFVIFFCRYNIMIARQYILLTPFLALLAARGIAELFARLRPRWARWSAGALLAATAASQAVFLVRAGESIRTFDLPTYAAQAMSYVADHPRQHFRVSEGVRKLAGQRGAAIPPNVVGATGTDSVDAVVFLGSSENGGLGERTCNDPWLTEAVFGPLEMNFNWYSTWVGRDRVVVMTLEKAKLSRVALAR